MNILITGANGQLGKEIGNIADHYGNCRFLFTDIDELDITNEKDIKDFFEKNQPDCVINCAAYTAVDKAETDVEQAQKINALAPLFLAKITSGRNAKMIHVSTDYVYDGRKNRPYSESDAVNPQTVYGKSKAEGEVNCLRANPDSVIVRTSWLYSSNGNNFVKTMLRLGREQNEIKVVFDQTGTPTNAADLAAALLEIAGCNTEKDTRFVPGIYHYSNEGAATWFDFALAVFEFSGTKCKVVPVLSGEFPAPAARPAYSVLNKSKIRNTFNLEVPYWRDSLKRCMNKILK